MQLNAKVVHDNLNAGGGSEYLSICTIDALSKMGFQVDLFTFENPKIEELRRDFGISELQVRKVLRIDLFELLQLDISGQVGQPSSQKGMRLLKNNWDDQHYDLVINTHGDLLPYYNYKLSKVHKRGDLSKNLVTYCHFPIVPHLTKIGRYLEVLRDWADSNWDEQKENLLKEYALPRAKEMYDRMMQATTILTNSHFSRNAIEQIYKGVKPIVIYPPVNIDKFHNVFSHKGRRENAILVLSRFSPDKEIENAVRIAGILKSKRITFKMTLAGNLSKENEKYLDRLKRMTEENRLQDNVHFEVDASFPRLLELMKESRVLLHPLAGEPFGIAIVEAMSAGLIPVVPDIGGNTEFVPKKYQFHNLNEAADIIAKRALMVPDYSPERSAVANIASRFSINNYQKNLRNIIETLLLPGKYLDPI